jgi:gliding motility-associated-like protein
MQMKKNILLKFVLLTSFFCFSQETFGQCSINIINLPDTILACKNSTVQLNPSVTFLNGSYLLDTTWSPALGLSDPNIINPVATLNTSSANYVLTVQSITPDNLIDNGDFTQGNTVFSSAYVYGTGGAWGLLSQEGQYAIATNPQSTHVNFASFGDHTSGIGNMMVLNGSSSSNTAIWCQTISVNPNTWYDFSAWGATCVASNPAILQFSINTVLVGTPLALPITTGLWTQFHVTWFSGANTSIDICINDQQTALSGNDFALDDITFKEICTVSDSVYINTINLTPSIQTTYMLGCENDSVQFVTQNGSGNTPSSYFWTFGDGAVSNDKDPLHVYVNQGVYNVKLITSLNGCTDSASVVITINHPLDAKFKNVDTTCVGNVVTIVDESVITGVGLYQWNWGDGIIDNTPFHVYTQAGLYTIQLILTDPIGCKDSFSTQIYVLNSPFGDFTLSKTQLCVGEPLFIFDTLNAYTSHFSWSFGDGKIVHDVHNPTHMYDGALNYTITLTAENSKCPIYTTQKSLVVFGYPTVNLGPDTSICPGLTGSLILTNLNANMNLPGTVVSLWNTGEQSSTLTVTEPGRYWLKESIGECSITDSIWIKRDCYLNIPNSFSPGGDGLNDYFLPRELLSSGLKTFKMNIYNRWGENIFSTTSIDGRGWDGMYNGEQQPMGVYVYVIEVEYANAIRKNYTGNVTLIR